MLANGLVVRARVCVQLVGPVDQPSMLQNLPSQGRMAARGYLQHNNQRVSRQESRQAMAQADHLRLPYQNAGHAAPSKLFDYLRNGRPILALTARNSTVESVLAKSDVRSVCIDPREGEAETDQKVLAFLDTTQRTGSAKSAV